MSNSDICKFAYEGNLGLLQLKLNDNNSLLNAKDEVRLMINIYM